MLKRTLLLTCLVLGLACTASADLVLHWALDETSGAVAKDSSGNGNDGVVGGTANWVDGNIRGALDFDASSTYIEQSNELVTGSCTLALWMKPRNLPYGSDYRSIIHGDVWESGCIHGHLRANTSLINFEPNGGGAVSSTTECVSDEWYHAVAAFDTGTSEGRLYINGVLEHTSSGVSSSLYIGAFNYGAWTGNRRFFDGIMDDIRIYDHAVTEEEVPAIMVGAGVELAAEPSPEDEQTDVIRDATLTWEPGQLAGTHDVYVGTSFEDVNAATVPTASGLSAPSFDPDRFEFGQTYYWRVDEVNGTPDKTVFKGDVWSFTAEPYSIQIPEAEIAVTASSSSNEFSLPENLINGSGLAEDGTHGITPVSMWFTATVDLDPWIQFEFDGVKQLDTMKVWNANSAAESAIGWGVKNLVIEYSVDGENWTVLPDANQISRAPGLSNYGPADEIAFNGVPAKMVRLDIESNWGGILMSYGLSEVQFNVIPAQARTLDPAPGTSGVLPDTTVTWRAGRDAAQHTIYIDTDADAVADGTAVSVSTSASSLDLGTLDLQLGETYYVRVDEVNDAEETTVWAGPVWTLDVAPVLIVDDFERYENTSPYRPFQTWSDGFGYSADEFFPDGYGGNGTGAGIGHDIWSLTSPYYDGEIMEELITMEGSALSMPFYYDNSGTAAAAETTANIANLQVSQDWSKNGIQYLSLHIRADSLSEALDTTSSFTASETVGWYSQTAVVQDDGDAAQSKAIGHNEDAVMQTTVTGAGTVSFDWKASSEAEWDFLEFYVDGEMQDQISGEVDWQPMTYSVTGAGSHTLEWRYFKDGAVSDGEDCGWVDKLLWDGAGQPATASGNTGQLYAKINGTRVDYPGSVADIQWGPWKIDLAALGINLQNMTTLAIGVDGATASGVLYFDNFQLESGE